MKSRSIWFLVCLLALACSGSEEPSGAGSDQIVLGLVAQFDRNQSAVDGAVLAVDEINAGGGVLVGEERRRISLIAEDDRGEPQLAVSKALKLINRDGVVALVGLPRSFTAIPVGRIAERQRVPMLSTMSTHPETTRGKSYVFRMAFLDSFQGKALAEFAFADLGARRAATLIDEVGPYNRFLAKVFGRAFRDLGGELVASERFTEDDLDVSSQIRNITDGGAEVLLLPNTFSTVGPQVLAARQAGFKGIFLGSDTWSSFGDAAGQAEFHGAFFFDFWAPGSTEERTRSFVASHRQRFGTEPSASAALSYDAVFMIAQVITQGGSATPEAVREGLANIASFRGVTGMIAYRGSGDPTRSIFVRRFGEDGQIHPHKEISP